MIALIRGQIEDIGENTVIVETGGVGYEVNMTQKALSRMAVDQEVRLHTFLQVREDAFTLFGFQEKEELEVFKLLIGVSGIGPKAALAVLGTISPNDLRFAVLSDDVKAISAVPGIGKKTAQKLILELKDKFDLQDTFEQKLVMTSLEADLPEGLPESRREAVQALTALGYGQSEAAKAVGKVWEQAENAEQMSTEDILRAALKYLG